MTFFAPPSLLYSPRLSVWCTGALAAFGLLMLLLNGRTLFALSTDNNQAASQAAAVLPRASIPLPMAVSAIAALNLFGNIAVNPVVDISALPTTKLNWKLVGIIGSSFTDESRSLIAIDNKPAKAFYKGDALPDGGVVYTIDSNFVIVQRGEQLEKLPLHAGSPIVSGPVRRSAPTNTVVTAPVRTEPVATTPVTPQTVYKELEDRLASIRQKKSS